MARKKSLRDTIADVADGIEGEPDADQLLLQEFDEAMEAYAREFKKWEGRTEKILKRYRDENRDNRTNGESRFNILWSNVQTLVPATFSKLPQPDVSRRFRDQDAVGRVAAMVLERALDFEIQHYADYRATLRQCVMDRFLGGRGTAWVRYEPHFKAVSKGEPDDGAQITEDTDEAPVDEAIDYECAPLDYIHWRDFGHEVARTWEEVTKVWRNVYMSEEAVRERFGDDIAKAVPYDASPETTQRKDRLAEQVAKKQALIVELWDKQRGKAYWFSKSLKKIIDQKDDPLGLQEFFPCPRPLYATLTNDSLIPVPDFTLYQDQANELDVLCDRIDGLIKMLQLKGVYDASVPELQRLFSEGENGTLIPIKNYAAFAEKAGLKGTLNLFELKPHAEALQIAMQAMEQVKNQVYEITGISDIIRGQTAASETATAQQIKGQYASLRLRSMQDEVARFATDCLQLKAQIICSKFSPSTIAAISAADQLEDTDKPMVFTAATQLDPAQPPAPPQPNGPAMVLLIGEERLADPAGESPNPLRSFRIEVAADTLVQLDEQQEKQDRIEFVTAVGTYIEKAAPVIQMSPQAGPLLLDLLKFGVRGFKVGKGIEGQFDAAIQGLKQTAAQPAPDPAQMEEQIRQQVTQELAMKNATKDIAVSKREADLDIRELKFNASQEIEKQKADFAKTADAMSRDHAERERKMAVREDESNLKMMHDGALEAGQKAKEQQKALEESQSRGDKFEQQASEMAQTIASLGAGLQQLQEQVAAIAKVAAAKKRVVRDARGLVQSIEPVT